MDLEAFEMLNQAMDIIEARETLTNFSISSYPHMKKEDQRKLHKKVHSAAFAQTTDSSKPVSTKDIAERLRRSLGG
jgi:hypothetical protein